MLALFDLPNLTVNRAYVRYLEKGKHMLFLAPSNNSTINMSGAAMNSAVVILALIARLSASIHFMIIMAGFGISAFAIWDMVRNFVTAIKSQTSMNQICFVDISIKYRQLVYTVQSINTMYSELFLWIVLWLSGWMCVNLDSVLKSHTYMGIVLNAGIMVSLITTLLLSAESNRMVIIFFGCSNNILNIKTEL